MCRIAFPGLEMQSFARLESGREVVGGAGEVGIAIENRG